MRTFFKAVTLAIVLASSSALSAAEDTQSIAVVFPSKILQQSPQIEKINKELQAEFKDRLTRVNQLQKELAEMDAKLKRDSELMSKEEVTSLKREAQVKMSELNLKGKALKEDTNRRQNEEQQKIIKAMRSSIQSIAEKNGYDLVLNAEQILFAKPELDISDIVIKEISKQ